MDKSVQILAMARELDVACAAGDWLRLAELATALTPQLQALSANGALTRPERQALTRLRAAHERAACACAATLDNLGSQLASLRDNKDGWLAYALATDTETA